MSKIDVSCWDCGKPAPGGVCLGPHKVHAFKRGERGHHVIGRVGGEPAAVTVEVRRFSTVYHVTDPDPEPQARPAARPPTSPRLALGRAQTTAGVELELAGVLCLLTPNGARRLEAMLRTAIDEAEKAGRRGELVEGRRG